jgi:hypothetical protein
MSYLDFDLRVELDEAGACRVSVPRSPAGEVSPIRTGQLPLEPITQALRALALTRGAPSRRAWTPDPPAQATAPLRTTPEYGRDLFEHLMPAAVVGAYRASFERARAEQRTLRLRLRIDDPELAQVPWEFLFDPVLGDHVCLSNDVSLVRYLDVPRAPSTLTVPPPLRVLALIASPSDLPVLDVGRERADLEQATEHLADKGVLQIEWLVDATWRDLQAAMRRGSWHAFHYIGHAGLDPETKTGVLALCDDAGATFLLGAAELGRLLSGHPSMRLAVLNACEGARTEGPDVFSSAGGALIRRGVPAVVAMQFPITDRAALEFSRAFYEALVDGASVDRAVGDARRAIQITQRGSQEWGTPVLHMHALDGTLFAVDLAGAVFRRPVAPAAPPRVAAPPPSLTFATLPGAPRPAAAQPASTPNLRRGYQLLAQKVRGYWVDGVLNRSLFQAALADLGMDRVAGAVDSPWATVLSESQPGARQLPPDKTVSDVFAEEGGSLLVLGEPGSGKTTSMLVLLRTLLDRAEADPATPVPAVFNLSSWTPGLDLATWLVDELGAKYQIPKTIGREWLAGSGLLPLLDGLDEVPDGARSACVDAINQFTASGICVGTVVCCRIKEYLALPNRLALNTAIQLRELTNDQVLGWVRSAGAPLSGLLAVLERDSDLLLDARSPLMLSLMAKAYQGVTPDALAHEGSDSAQARRDRLMEAYVRRMFRRAAGADA